MSSNSDESPLILSISCANYLTYLVRHPSLKNHPTPLGHGWELVGSRCRPVRHTRLALPTHLPAPGSAEESEEDEREEEESDGWQFKRRLSASGGRQMNDLFFIIFHFTACASAMVLLFLSP